MDLTYYHVAIARRSDPRITLATRSDHDAAVYVDKKSGSTTNRPGLHEALEGRARRVVDGTCEREVGDFIASRAAHFFCRHVLQDCLVQAQQADNERRANACLRFAHFFFPRSTPCIESANLSVDGRGQRFETESSPSLVLVPGYVLTPVHWSKGCSLEYGCDELP